MTLDLAKSILALLAWPTACVAIAVLVCNAPALAQRLDAFFFGTSRGGGR